MRLQLIAPNDVRGCQDVACEPSAARAALHSYSQQPRSIHQKEGTLNSDPSQFGPPQFDPSHSRTPQMGTSKLGTLRLASLLLVGTLALTGCRTTSESTSMNNTQSKQPASNAAESSVAPDSASSSMDTPADDGSMPIVDPLSVTGDIVSAGSSTVFPLSERMAERFKNEGYEGNITVDSIGSGAGFDRFCVAGETDIANASRPIKDSEVESCREIGREPLEFRVGTDALAVSVSTANDFAEDVTMEDLVALFSTAETWSEVRAGWPDEPIERFIPGTDSGTFDYFVEEVFDEDKEPILAANPQMSEDDNVLVQGIEGSPYAVGFFGYAYYAENSDRLRVLAIDGVEATAASVDAGTYPLARPLYLYTTAGILREKPQVAAFVNFFLTYVNDEVVDVGYFPAADDVLDSARLSFVDALGR